MTSWFRVELPGNEKYNHYRHEVLQFLYECQRNPGEDKSEMVEKKVEKTTSSLSVVKTEAA